MFDTLKKIGTSMLLSASVLPLGTGADAMSVTAPTSNAPLQIGTCSGTASYNMSPSPAGATVGALVELYIPGQANAHHAAGVLLLTSNSSANPAFPNIAYWVTSGIVITAASLQSCGLSNVQMLTSSPASTPATTVQNYGALYVRFRATEQGVQYDYDLTVTANGVTWATRTATGGSVAPQFSTAPFLQSRANQLVNNQTDLINIVNGNASNVFNAQASDGVGSFDLRLMSDTGFWAEASGKLRQIRQQQNTLCIRCHGGAYQSEPKSFHRWFD